MTTNPAISDQCDELLEQLDVALDVLSNLHADSAHADLMHNMLERLPGQLDEIWPQGWPEQVKHCQQHLLRDLNRHLDGRIDGPNRALAFDKVRRGLQGLVHQVQALS